MRPNKIKSQAGWLITAGFALLLSACATPKGSEAEAEVKSPPTATEPGQTKSESSPDTWSTITARNAVAKAPEQAPAVVAAGQAPQGSGAASQEPPLKAEQLLIEGTELYDRGDYKGAIRKLLLARDSAIAPSSTRQSSLKYLAFSYCVSGQKPLCKAQFVSLLKTAPDYQLGRGEAGHPLWGPAFKEAKQESVSDIPTSARSKK